MIRIEVSEGRTMEIGQVRECGEVNCLCSRGRDVDMDIIISPSDMVLLIDYYVSQKNQNLPISAATPSSTLNLWREHFDALATKWKEDMKEEDMSTHNRSDIDQLFAFELAHVCKYSDVQYEMMSTNDDYDRQSKQLMRELFFKD